MDQGEGGMWVWIRARVECGYGSGQEWNVGMVRVRVECGYGSG